MSGKWFWVCTIAFAFLVGCKSKAPPPTIVEAEGVVLLDGEPLKRVRVRFIPVGGYEQEYSASGVTDDTGKFTLTCRGQPGAALGENVVVVEESEIPENLRGKGRIDEKERLELNKYYQSLGNRPPAKYGNLANSPMTVNVNPNQKSYKLFLTGDQETK